MLQNVTHHAKKYLFSNYKTDRQNPGYWTFNGRLISLIDIPSQGFRAIASVSALFLVSIAVVSSAGIFTSKTVTCVIMSLIPRSDKTYWKNHRAAAWEDVKDAWIGGKNWAAYGARSFLKHVCMIGVDLLGCTFMPKTAANYRIENVRSYKRAIHGIYVSFYHASKNIRTGKEPLPVDLASLNLNEKMKESMKIIVDDINSYFATNTRPESLLYRRNGVIENITTNTGPCLRGLVEAGALYSCEFTFENGGVYCIQG